MPFSLKKSFLTLSLLTSSTFIFALPNIAVLATGGTIAGTGTSATGSAYTAGKVEVNHLIKAVPTLANIANITPFQIASIGSQDMSDEVQLKLAKTINKDCDKFDGFVITHGTDTLEETAYFLQLTNQCHKPIVLVGAMLPSTALGADGPRNLYNAVVTASDPKTSEQGIVVAMNNIVITARDVIKTNTVQVDTFKPANYGIIGTIFNNQVNYTTHPPQSNQNVPFDITHITTLPKVGIVYNHSGVDSTQADALIKAGYRGIVSAGVGNGNIHKDLWKALELATEKGIIVVRSSRVPTGATTKNGEVDDIAQHWVSAGDLNPQKARILLQLSLTKTHNWETIQQYFDKY